MNIPINSYAFFIASLGLPPEKAAELFKQFNGSTTVATAIAPEKNSDKPTKHADSVHIGMRYQNGLRTLD